MRGGDGWRDGQLPEGIDMTLEPFGLLGNPDALLEGMESVILADPQYNALDQRINTHRLYGTARVEAIREMGTEDGQQKQYAQEVECPMAVQFSDKHCHSVIL